MIWVLSEGPSMHFESFSDALFDVLDHEESQYHLFQHQRLQTLETPCQKSLQNHAENDR